MDPVGVRMGTVEVRSEMDEKLGALKRDTNKINPYGLLSLIFIFQKLLTLGLS